MSQTFVRILGFRYIKDLFFSKREYRLFTGFLLSSLATNDVQLNRFSTRKFLLRRLLRIWPVYYLVISIGLILYFGVLPAMGIPFDNHINFKTTALLSYLFLSNFLEILFNPGSIIAITWSVSFEEQFYLLFPFWVRLFYRSKKIRILAASVVLIIVILIDIYWPWPAGYLELYNLYFEFFLIGILASELLPSLLSKSANTRKILFWLGVFLFFISFTTNLTVFFDGIYSRLVMGMIAAFAILSFCASPIKIASPLLITGGRISYGIYMYHMIVITGIVYITHTLFQKQAVDYPVSTILMINVSAVVFTYLAALLSYQTFEKFFLKKKSY